MQIKVPYLFYDNIMTARGRVQSMIQDFEGTINADGIVKNLIYSGNNTSRLRPCDIKKFEDIQESNYKTFKFEGKYACPFQIGQEVIYQYDSYGAHCTPLVSGKIEEIEFYVSQYGNAIFWYRVNGKKVDRYSIYKTKEEFIRRTSPTKELRENERYFFTRYCIQQNSLVPKEIINRTQSHTIIDHACDDERLRNEFLFTSKEKFYNKMFANL